MTGKRAELRDAVRSLLAVNLSVGPSEGVLLLGDTAEEGTSRDLVEEMAPFVAAENQLARLLIFQTTGGHGKEPPREVWEAALGTETVQELEGAGLLQALLDKTVDADGADRAEKIVLASGNRRVPAIVALTTYSISHTLFRRLATAGEGARFASMPLFSRDMFFGSMAVDWAALSVSTRTLARSLEGADRCEIRSPNGTNLVVGVRGRPVMDDDGLLGRPGSFGNLPAGEVFLAPLEGTTEGELVVEWGAAARFTSPLRVTVQRGRAVAVKGDDREAVSWLTEKFDAHENNTNVAELGIGTNPRASRPDNVLEAEKILGTVHVAFGDNAGFGGTVKAPFHQDFVVFYASLVAVWERGGGRRVLLDQGRPGW